jgi:hypothetical protein
MLGIIEFEWFRRALLRLSPVSDFLETVAMVAPLIEPNRIFLEVLQ